MLIRQEAAEDFARIDEVLDAAFGGTEESGIVRRIRQTNDFIPELALVAVDDNRVVIGHIMLSYVELWDEQTAHKVLALGPVSVDPSHQKGGVGAALINAAISTAEKRGDNVIVLLGHANYYPRFGFVPAAQHDIYPALPWKNESFMVRTTGNAKSEARGTIRYPDGWQIRQSSDAANVSIRQATKEDMATAARVFMISFRHALPHLPVLHSPTEDVEYFSNQVFENHEVYVAEDKETRTIHGFIAFDDSMVHSLYVLPFSMGTGIGAQLLAVAQSKRSRLQLWAFQKNERALAFYAKHGFYEIKRTDGEGNEERDPDVLLEWVRAV